MDLPMREFTDLLLNRGVVSLDQLSEAKLISKKDVNNEPIGQILIRLGYATGEEVTMEIGRAHV